MIRDSSFPQKILWIDLEMTGLEPTKDVILEIATEITDFDFKLLARYEACVAQPRELVESRMDKNKWWASYPLNRQEFVENLAQGVPSEQVEQEVITLIGEHFKDEPVILGGNSIHNDRNFIKQWWPKLDDVLHYRMLDVSSLKIVMQGMYGTEFQKQKSHRALDDIHESIAELQFYLEQLKNAA